MSVLNKIKITECVRCNGGEWFTLYQFSIGFRECYNLPKAENDKQLAASKEMGRRKFLREFYGPAVDRAFDELRASITELARGNVTIEQVRDAIVALERELGL